MDIENLRRCAIRLRHVISAVLAILLVPNLHYADAPDREDRQGATTKDQRHASEAESWRRRLRRYDDDELKRASHASQLAERKKRAEAARGVAEALATEDDTTDAGPVAPVQHMGSEYDGGGFAIDSSLAGPGYGSAGSCCDSGGCGECTSGSCGPSFSDCGSGCSGCQLCRSQPGCAWVRAEYLLWWVDGVNTPPLLTTSPLGVDRDAAGVIGQPGTRALFGGDDLADGARSGGRISFGLWLDPCTTTGIQGSYFGLADEREEFRAVSGGDPILARPFFNLEPGMEGQDAEFISFPGLFSGQAEAHAETRLQGADVLIRRALCRTACHRIDLLVGWRYNRLDDKVFFQDSRTVLSGDTGLTVGTEFEEFDRFETENSFHGATIGAISSFCKCRWTFELAMKLALGNNHSQVNIDGQAISRVPLPGGGVQEAVTPAGLLAQATNIGSFENDEFAVIPELGVTIGYDVTCNLTATFGYTFIYWSNVARAGDQIDLDLNLSQLAPGGLVGAPRPAFPWATTDMWAQGLSLGMEYRF